MLSSSSVQIAFYFVRNIEIRIVFDHFDKIHTTINAAALSHIVKWSKSCLQCEFSGLSNNTIVSS